MRRILHCVWLVAFLAVAAPAAEQEAPGNALSPDRVASDPALVAASDAWHAAWRESVEAHLRVVAARGTPRDLVLAGLLWPPEDDPARSQASGSFRRVEADGWLQAAYDADRGEDALVDRALLDACASPRLACDRRILLDRLVAADPGNAAVLLAAYDDAMQRRDTAAAERRWRAASDAPRYRSGVDELGLALATVLRRAPAPALDPALASALGEDLGIGRAATPRDMADMAAMGITAAIAVPSFRSLGQRCTPQVGRLPADTLAACRRLHARLADDESILVGPMIALPRLVEWAESDAERDVARARLRRLAWTYENALRLRPFSASGGRLSEDYIDRFLRDGELAAMRHQLQANGIAAEPPAGWLPSDPRWRGLLAAEAAPAP